MKTIKVNYSLPAFLSDFSQDEINEKFTRAKIKLMYIGETQDKRIFTENFAKELIKTLPYTPVVSYYDTDKKDFVGHHSEQAIYGIVDPLIPPTFEKDEEGKTWAIASVILYTERPDSTGEVAKKIVGKSQSLEMDPDSVEYTINYDGRQFRNVEFTKGSFIGVSVLGDNQKPAFAGAGFFTEQSASAFAQLKEYCSKRGSKQMNVEQIYSFIELSWGDKYKVVAKALDEKYGEFMAQVVDFYDEYVISWVCSQDYKTSALVKISYSINPEGIVALGDAIPVHVVYEPLPLPLATPVEEVKIEDKQEEEKHQDEIHEDENSEMAKIKKKCEIDEEEKDKEDDEEEEEKDKLLDASKVIEPILAAPVETLKTIEVATEAENKDVKENDEQVKKDSANSAALAESQLKELAAYRTKEKVDCINGYANTLPSTMIADYIAKSETLTLAEIQVQLNEQFRKFAPRARKINQTFLSLSRESDTTKAPSIKELVDKYK